MNHSQNYVKKLKNQLHPMPEKNANPFKRPDSPWTIEEHSDIVDTLLVKGCQYLRGRDEYTLLKEVLQTDVHTEVLDSGNNPSPTPPAKQRGEGSGVISAIGYANMSNDTTSIPSSNASPSIASVKALNAETGSQAFLAPLDLQKSSSIADTIPSFKMIQSSYLRLNIGFDTELQYYTDSTGVYRDVLCLMMSIALGDSIIRYIFLIDPRYQRVTADGGQIPLKYCIADILSDVKQSYVPGLPRILKKELVYKDKEWAGHDPYKVLDFKAMKDCIIPVTLICHTGKADISVFRRTKYDVDVIHKLGEIQSGWMNTRTIRFKAEADDNYNYYWLIDLQIRDTLGLTPAEAKSLKALGQVINRPKIELKEGYIEHMASYAVEDPIGFYEYACNDADIVIDFVSELFMRNRAIPMTLSSAAASAMRSSIKKYMGTPKQPDYDKIFRGLELLDEGITPDKDQVERVEAKASVSFNGYIGKDLPRKQLLSIIAGYLAEIYSIPVLDGKSQADIVETVNTWGLTDKPITKNDVKNCTRSSRKNSWLPYEYVADMLDQIHRITS